MPSASVRRRSSKAGRVSGSSSLEGHAATFVRALNDRQDLYRVTPPFEDHDGHTRRFVIVSTGQDFVTEKTVTAVFAATDDGKVARFTDYAVVPGADKFRALKLAGLTVASNAAGRTTNDRLFIGVYPGGVVYADRKKTVQGDYARVGFLPYDSLEFKAERGADAKLVAEARAHAEKIAARRGEPFSISSSGQTVILGRAGGSKPRELYLVWTSKPNEDFGTDDEIIGEASTLEKAKQIAERYSARMNWGVPSFHREEIPNGVETYFSDSCVLTIQKLYKHADGSQSVYPPSASSGRCWGP